MKHRTTLAPLVATVAMLAFAQPAAAVGETGSALVSGTVIGSLALTVPAPAAISTMTVGANEWAASNVLVSDTDAAAGWVLKANEAAGDGKMELLSDPLGICAASASPLTNAMQVYAGDATDITGGTVTINAPVGSPLTLSGTAGAVATAGGNAVSLATVPVTYKQTIVTDDNVKAGCTYNITVNWALSTS